MQCYTIQSPKEYEFNHELVQSVAGNAWRTDWLYYMDHPIIPWIEEQIPAAVCHLVGSNPNIMDSMAPRDYTMISGGGRGQFNYNNFTVVSAWGIHYDNGQGLVMHNHFPYSLSFVYMINDSPTPLILDNKEIPTVKQNLHIFPSHLDHCVRPDISHSRDIIAGNILYHD